MKKIAIVGMLSTMGMVAATKTLTEAKHIPQENTVTNLPTLTRRERRALARKNK